MTKGILAIFVILLPILTLCLLAWIFSGFWEFIIGYFFLWFMVLSILGGFKIMGAFDD